MGERSMLVAYGIQTETNVFRAHVSPVSKTIYLFRTQAAMEAIMTGRYPFRSVYTRHLVTAEGYLIPPSEIPGLIEWPIKPELLRYIPIHRNSPTSVKGRLAEFYVAYMLKDAKPVRNKEQQYEGHDLLYGNITIQVKCDYYAGDGGTGNLFIQIAEANPYRSH